MAPYPLSFDSSDLSRALFSSAIFKRHASPSPSLSNHLPGSDGTQHHEYRPGRGTKSPQDMNNKAYFALFAILGAAMVLTSIWFFFWAKNGGFVWRSNDWDDYKSTVLRRKGKDGKTLSNATPQTDLGEKSIAGTFDVERDNDHIFQVNDYGRRHNYGNRKAAATSRPPRRREPTDDDLRAYRHEKPARVGGLNRAQDGSHYDFSSSEPSEVASNNSRVHLNPTAPKKKGYLEKKRERKEEKKAEKRVKQEHKIDKKNAAKRRKRGHVFAADEASDAGVGATHYRRGAHHMSDPNNNPVDDDGVYFASYRPPAPPHAPSRRYEAAGAGAWAARQSTAPRNPSPLKQSHPRVPGSFDSYSDDATSDTGTKVYEHHIPGLSRGSRNTGFRRGRGRPGRRDSLSDSENGDLGARRV